MRGGAGYLCVGHERARQQRRCRWSHPLAPRPTPAGTNPAAPTCETMSAGEMGTSCSSDLVVGVMTLRLRR